MNKLNLTIEQIEELLKSRPSMFNCALLLDLEELHKRNNELVKILGDYILDAQSTILSLKRDKMNLCTRKMFQFLK
jgi:hypothetical protein